MSYSLAVWCSDLLTLTFGLDRGSKDVSMQAASQFKLNPNFRMLSLNCSGTEEHIYDCQKNTQDTCKVIGQCGKQASCYAIISIIYCFAIFMKVGCCYKAFSQLKI